MPNVADPSVLVQVGIALGSNLGPRESLIDQGIEFLRALAFNHLVVESSRFLTEPVDCPPGSEPFLNSVAELTLDSTSWTPPSLLHACQAFEQELGRADHRLRPRHAPRPLDLDLLYFGDLEQKTSELILPHPRLHLRRFVLQPLSELRPLLVLPGQSVNVQTLKERLI